MNAKPCPVAGKEPLSKSRLRLWLKLLKASALIEDELRRQCGQRQIESLDARRRQPEQHAGDGRSQCPGEYRIREG